MPGLPRVPGLGELIAVLRTQSEALAQLPRTLADLNKAVFSLVELLAATRETVEATQRVAQRLDGIVDELDEPVRALRPGLERLAAVLDDPVVDTVPETLRHLSEDVVPLVHGLRETQARISAVGGSMPAEKLGSLVGAFLRPRQRRAGPADGTADDGTPADGGTADGAAADGGTLAADGATVAADPGDAFDRPAE